MNFLELKAILGIADSAANRDTISISVNTLSKNIDALIEYCYGNQPIIIRQVQFVSEDASSQSLAITGVSSFLGVADLAIEAQFWIDSAGDTQLSIEYLLIGEVPAANAWHFSRSFPNLPTVVDNNEPTYFNRQTQEVHQTLVAPLDQLFLFNTCFIVASEPYREKTYDVDLQWGINFVSHLRPQGFLGVIQSLFQHKNHLTIYGTIRQPRPIETPQNLAIQHSGKERFLYPWSIEKDIDKGLHGILLQIDFDLNYEVFKGKIEFKADKFYLYTPLTNEWLLPSANPALVPMQAYTGALSLPSAGIDVEVISPVQLGIDELTLLGSFEGVSLSNLSQLAGLTGSDQSPLASLPESLKKLGNQLGKLELINASVSVDYTNLDYITVSHAAFTVGMPDLKWQVWEDNFEIDSIYCTFDISYPFITKADQNIFEERVVDITLYGNLEIEQVPFSIYASSLEGYTVYAEMAKAQTLPLSRVIEKYAPGIEPPSDLTINVFRVGIAPEKEYSMALALAQAPQPWVIPIGPTSLAIEDVAMGFSYPKGGPISGSVSGTVLLGDFAQFSLVYDTPGDVIMRAMIPEVSLMQLVNTLTDKPVALPGDFDIHLKNNSILIQKQAQNYLFQLATEVVDVGSFAFQVQKIGSQWGFAAGFSMAKGAQPSDLSGLGAIGDFVSFFSLHSFLLVVSSFDAPSFTFPDIAAFNNPVIKAKQIALPSGTQGLMSGLNIFAQWNFDSSKQQQLLKKLLGIDSASLAITLQVSENPSLNSKLFASTAVAVGGLQLTAQFGGLIANGQLGLFLRGELLAPIQGSMYKFSTTLLFVANGAFLSGTMVGPKPIDFGAFKLGNLALEVGINWEGIPSLGIAGTIAVDNFQSSVALFFNANNPSQSMVAGSLSDLTLKDIVETFVGDFENSEIIDALELVGVEGTREFYVPSKQVADLVHALDTLDIQHISSTLSRNGKIEIPTSSEQVLLVAGGDGNKWYVTDRVNMIHYQLEKLRTRIRVSRQSQLYFVPQSTSIGDIPFEEGFRVSGALQMFFLRSETDIEIRRSKGIAIDTYMDKIVIGSDKLFSLKALKGEGGPRLSVATFTQLDHPIKDFQKPHFYINGQLTLLGMSREIFVTLSEDGFEFLMGGDLVLAVHGEIHGHFKGITDMAAGGSLDVKVGTIDLGPLGKVPINTGVSGMLDIKVDKKATSVTFDASFELLGKTHKIAKFDIEVEHEQLKDLVSIVYQKIKDFLVNLFKDVKAWAEAVGKKIIKGVEDVAKVLQEEFGKTLKEAEDIIEQFGLAIVACATTTATALM